MLLHLLRRDVHGAEHVEGYKEASYGAGRSGELHVQLEQFFRLFSQRWQLVGEVTSCEHKSSHWSEAKGVEHGERCLHETSAGL